MEALPLTSPLFWLLAVGGIILTGISKSGFAGGAGVVAVPMLGLVITLPQATALMLPLLIAMDIKTIHLYRRSMNGNELKAILPAALLGIATGGLMMGVLSDQALQLMLGTLSVLFASWQRLTPLMARFKGASWLWGAVSGFTSTLIHAGGPPINIYLISRQLPKLVWLATAGAFFGVMNLVKIIPYSMNDQWQTDLLLLSLVLLPVAYLGVWLGHHIQQRISEPQFMTICRVLLLVSGTLLVMKSIG